MTEQSQILNQILGLATQIEKLKAHQEQVSSHIQSASTYTESIERITRGTNLTMEGIARITDSNHEYLRLLEQSVKQLQETQLDTSSLREGVHQLVSDSFMRLQRYMEQRYPSGQPLDLGRVRSEAQREVVADLLGKVEQILDQSGEEAAYPQTTAQPSLQHQAALLQQEVTAITERQTKALHLLDTLRQDTPILKRLVYPVIERDKREKVITELAQLIKSGTKDKQNLGLADNLMHYMQEVNALLKELRELRNQMLTLLTAAPSTTASAGDSLFDLDSPSLGDSNATMVRHYEIDDNSDDSDENEDYKEDFQVDDEDLLFKAEQR